VFHSFICLKRCHITYKIITQHTEHVEKQLNPKARKPLAGISVYTQFIYYLNLNMYGITKMSINSQITKVFGFYRASTPEAVQESHAEWLKSLQFFESQLTSSGEPFFGGPYFMLYIVLISYEMWRKLLYNMFAGGHPPTNMLCSMFVCG
jgi:hypothetical protein